MSININRIYVPKDVEFISEWPNFSYPEGHLILDKTICGCGFTEYCITNDIPTILCSPRKSLLHNKKAQHPEENVYYFKNDNTIENYDLENGTSQNNEEKSDYVIGLKMRLDNWIGQMNLKGLTPKILVTYDSLHYVLEVLGNYSDNFSIVVDEFQAIFLDAAFKADVEIDFMEDLKPRKNVLYLSATPMLEKYLGNLDYFKDLPFYKFYWDNSRIENIRIERRIVKSINKELEVYIKNYRNGNYPNKVLAGGIFKESRELVIFVNSVKTICDIIKKNKLLPEETNIICSETVSNSSKLAKLKHTIGSAPLRGEPHKMFTLCTRTTYLGSDFYSTSAYTIICSDCSIKTLTVDISLDLPQIVGRQRLKENVFRNEVLFLYKGLTKKDATINLTEEEYDALMNEQDKNTKILLEGYSKMTDEEKSHWSKVAKNRSDLYQDDFLGISKRTGKATYNYLVKIAKQRAFDVSRKEYQDMVTIKRGIESLDGYSVVDHEVNNEIIEKFVQCFNSTGIFNEKMRLLCDFIDNYNEYYTTNLSYLLTVIPRKYQNYIEMLGTKRIRSLSCEEHLITDYINSNNSLGDNSGKIKDMFEVGNVYSKAYIKEELRKFYSSLGINKTPKAVDILDYFEIKETKLLNKETGKRDSAFEIIRKKL